MTLILRLVAALLKDEGGKTPLHEIARRQCMQVLYQSQSAHLVLNTEIIYNDRNTCLKLIIMHMRPEFLKPVQTVRARNHRRTIAASLQDFMGFLHIGWDLATTEDSDEKGLMSLSPAWEAASRVPAQLQNNLSVLEDTVAHMNGPPQKENMLHEAWVLPITRSKQS